MSSEQTKRHEITLIGRTFTPATNDGRQGWEFRYVAERYPVWFGTESTDLTCHLAAALDEIVRLQALITEWDAAHTAWLSPPGRAPIGAAESRRLRLHAAEDALAQEARREQ